MPTDTRERRIRAAVPCPTCGAQLGQPCRAGTAPHDPSRGAVDMRPTLGRVHTDRRLAWLAAKHAGQAASLFARGREILLAAQAPPKNP